MSNISGDEGSFSSGEEEVHQETEQQQQQPNKKKRNLPGTPDPNAEVVALSPTTLMARYMFVCEICNKGFQRDQNLQLHRRGHNLPWKLKQTTSTTEPVKKRVYVCPEPSCVHHNAACALGDLTGIKKHYSRKHGEKKWKCEKCSKRYAVESDWKAHHKTCGTREYKCACGTIFSRRDSFITHRAFCDALTEENNRVLNHHGSISEFKPSGGGNGPMLFTRLGQLLGGPIKTLQLSSGPLPAFNYSGSAHMSATSLLQKAAEMGPTASNADYSGAMQQHNPSLGVVGSRMNGMMEEEEMTNVHDFLGMGIGGSSSTSKFQ